MRRIILALAVLAALALPAAAALYQHIYSTANAPVSVTATPTTKTFIDNQSNGTGLAFTPRTIQVRSCAGNTGQGCTGASANTCYIHPGDGSVDKTKDYPLEPGASIIITFPRDRVTSAGVYGWPSVTVACDTAETAIFRIDAWD